MDTPHIVISAGEPAGIGPELLVQLAQQSASCRRVVVADPQLLQQRAAAIGLPLHLTPWRQGSQEPQRQGELDLLPVPLVRPSQPGQLDPANAAYVLQCLDQAVAGCLAGHFDALVTAPVHKGIISDAGTAFSGHTEYLAERTGTRRVVMMLATPTLRVALATTHLPLAQVPAQITAAHLEEVIRITAAALRQHFGFRQPRIAVLGLNPHAGEGGHLGREELDVIQPLLERLRAEGLSLPGPLPADTAFTPARLAECDAVLAMYHDQGLPVLKAQGFGEAVNVTLGLPIIRTSVDHGTALDLAGTGRADAGSLAAALAMALHLVERRSDAP